jgi:AcrR family transcriptional regulator
VTTDGVILEAALDQLALTGVRRTSTDDIARRAGINRATLYRRFGSREELLSAVYLHEAGRLIARLSETVQDVPEPGTHKDFDAATNVVDYFSTAVRLVRRNELLQRMLVVDREDTLTALTIEAGPVLKMCTAVLADRIRALHRWQGRPDTAVEDLAAALARLAQSLVLTPSAPPRLRTHADYARFGRAVIVPMVLHPSLVE